ncbi:SET domain-containing protein-lysine N-methyltransferase [Candidatus Dojkabacteria bacterium]|nr:SET domain-containing protein-lysine N-methyltransferase [Candidatus Dojkabacteria bacterium]
MDNVIVKSSSIQGKGVYSLKNFRAGEVVLEIDDTHLVTDPKQLTNEEYESHCDYFDNKVVLMQSPEVYINHSCDPNTYVKTIDGIRKVLAMRDIKINDEITYDYSINGDNDGTFDCSCRSKNCREAYQGNFFKLPKDIQLKYLPYLDGWFTEKYKRETNDLKM